MENRGRDQNSDRSAPQPRKNRRENARTQQIAAQRRDDAKGFDSQLVVLRSHQTVVMGQTAGGGARNLFRFNSRLEALRRNRCAHSLRTVKRDKFRARAPESALEQQGEST